VKLKMMERLESVQQETREVFALAKEIGEQIQKFSASEVYLEGASNILSLPDFTNPADLQNLFKIVEEKQILTSLLENELAQNEKALPHSPMSQSQGERKKRQGQSMVSHVKVRIGSENPNKALQNLSVISTTYQLSDHTVGVLGILGPKRMEYPKMIALVDYVSQMVNRLLKEFDEEQDPNPPRRI
jgi:heat-inducible transcriptional repressor